MSGRQVMRRIGPKRTPGTGDGLTRPQAEARLRELIASTVPRGAATSRTGIAEAGAWYVANMRDGGRKASSVRGVESHLHAWLEPHFAGKSLDAITPEDVRDLITVMRAGSRRRKQGGVGPATIRRTIGTLSAIFNYACHVDRRWATQNPCRAVTLPKAPHGRLRFLTPDEVRLTVAAVPVGPRRQVDRTVILSAAMTGLRQGELLALRWRDVDWHARRVRVVDNWVLGEYVAPKSETSKWSVPLGDDLAGDLHRWWQASDEPDDGELVFADPLTGRPLAKPQLLRRYRRALEAAGARRRSDVPRAAPLVRDHDGVGRRADPHHSVLDGARRHRHDAALRALRPECARGRVGRHRVPGDRGGSRIPIRYQSERISGNFREPDLKQHNGSRLTAPRWALSIPVSRFAIWQRRCRGTGRGRPAANPSPMYFADVVRDGAREIRDVARAGTPTHGHLRDRLVGILVVTVGVDLVCAVIALFLERGVKKTEITNFGDALFWTSTQLLTVSSSIMNPVSSGGRVLDVVMELYAITVVATLAGAMGSFMVKRAREAEQASPGSKRGSN